MMHLLLLIFKSFRVLYLSSIWNIELAGCE
jgi:hypothetical protein